FMQPSVEALLAEAEALAPAPDLHMFVESIRSTNAIQHGRYDAAVAHQQAVDKLAAAMPGVAPMGSACFLIWTLAAVGRREEARVALRRAEAIPNLARWYPRPVMVEAGGALLAGDPAGVDAAIAAASGPMPFTVAIMRTIGAE